ncbi:hypothetical protein Moror_603 [Moniliophthora roreri MCA 2997]|uniref:Uncharacterized protein n=1 Tax=Moniliophthora roreri (strain MCA 2997) TaxID=1381753 RepID=V2XZB5_MONRO|nr:hypothetical protein Moror_603 [Moniliophthora roreri MCA 2997]
MSMSELNSWIDPPTYFWSHDEAGQTKIPEDKWETLGLPTLIPRALPPATANLTLPRVKSSFRLFWWPKYVYSAIKDWEAVPGFDPAMPDFACHPGYPELEIIKARKQERRGFEKVIETERTSFKTHTYLYSLL